MVPSGTEVASQPLVDIRNLKKVYKLISGREIVALNGVDMTIKKGETFGIVGPNGSGKTTTMKILLGLIYPTEGEAYLFGREPGDNEVQRRVGYLPEAPYFYEFLTGRELLHYYGSLCGVSKDIIAKRTDDLLKMVDLYDRGADMMIRFYSRGMRQRIGIAQTMINDPELLILDEPTNGLDPIGTVQVRQFILEQKRQGRTIILCSHLLSEVEAVADSVAILHRGNLLATGPVAQIVPESKQWQLVVTDLTRDAIGTLKSEGINLDVHGDVITYLSEDMDDVYKVLGRMRDVGGKLVEITRPQPTLEEQFLKAVGEDDLNRTIAKLQR